MATIGVFVAPSDLPGEDMSFAITSEEFMWSQYNWLEQNETMMTMKLYYDTSHIIVILRSPNISKQPKAFTDWSFGCRGASSTADGTVKSSRC